MNAPLLEFQAVSCTRGDAVLVDISLRLAAGGFHVLTGDGAQRLFARVAGLLETPDAGEVVLAGTPTAALDEASRAELRGLRCGFLFSAPHLLPGMSVIENVAMPVFKLLGVEASEARTHTEAALACAGLAPSEADVATLGWLDQQRVALARALAHRPALLVLDHVEAGREPEEFLPLLAQVRQASEACGVTVLAAFDAAPPLHALDRVLHFVAGRVTEDRIVPPAPSVTFS
jgi:predicted ABC-type transport system involved in lysophospholipase L1 biosynthesis ATPase subunit